MEVGGEGEAWELGTASVSALDLVSGRTPDFQALLSPPCGRGQSGCQNPWHLFLGTVPGFLPQIPSCLDTISVDGRSWARPHHGAGIQRGLLNSGCGAGLQDSSLAPPAEGAWQKQSYHRGPGRCQSPSSPTRRRCNLEQDAHPVCATG